MYAQLFEADPATTRAPCADIYSTEMPGGQISNLRQQCNSMGLGGQFEQLKQKYIEVNRMFGHVVKVTPSSKVVGDTALFMLQNDISVEQMCDPIFMKDVQVPESLRDYLNGGLGVPHVGFNEKLVRAVLQLSADEYKNRKLTHISAEDVDFADLAARAAEMRPGGEKTELDALSLAIYPSVFAQFCKDEQKDG